MLKELFEIYKKNKMDKKIKKIAYSLNINNEFGLCINGLLISEFNYLFTYILRKLDIEEFTLDFENFETIYEYSIIIINAINVELSKDILEEQASLNVSKATAVHNMKNLKEIIEKISQYVFEIKELE